MGTIRFEETQRNVNFDATLTKADVYVRGSVKEHKKKCEGSVKGVLTSYTPGCDGKCLFEVAFKAKKGEVSFDIKRGELSGSKAFKKYIAESKSVGDKIGEIAKNALSKKI